MKILISDKTENDVIKKLKDAGYEVVFNEMDPNTLVKEIPNFDALMVRSRTKVIKEVFGEHAYEVPVSSIKSMIGHSLGAAGSIEVVASVLTIRNQFTPPTINYEFPDPECDLDYVPNRGRKTSVKTVLTNSYGFGGKNSAIIIKEFSFS